MTAVGNPKHAIHRADRPANASADGAANQPAHRTGSAVAFVRTLLRAAYDALGLPGMRDREQCESQRRTGKQTGCRRN